MSDTQNYMHPVLFRKQRAMSVDFLATSPNAKITTLQYIQIFIVSKVSDGYLTFELPIWPFFFLLSCPQNKSYNRDWFLLIEIKFCTT